MTNTIICSNCGSNTANKVCEFCNESPLLEGKYKLVRLLGEGGQGTVFFAQDQANKGLAIKRFRLGIGMDTDQWERLEREIQFLRQLNHPKIPNYIDHFRARSGPERYLYLVQEYVEGQNLSQLMEKTRYDANDVMKLVAQIAEVLVYLHNLTPPVIHRDVKPSNIMQRSDGSIFLIDFGCVRDSAMNTFGATLGVGTFLYMAPEQHQGQVSPAVDIYSLGVTAGHLLSRKPPTALRPWNRDSNLDKELLSLIDSMLQHNPKKRPSASLVQSKAFSFAYGQPKQKIVTPKVESLTNKTVSQKSYEHNTGTDTPTDKPKKRSRLLLLAIVAALFVITNMFNRSRNEPQPIPSESESTHEYTDLVPQSPDPLSQQEQRLRDILIHDFHQGVVLDKEQNDKALSNLCEEGYDAACVWKQRKSSETIEDTIKQYSDECIHNSDAINCMIAGWGATQSSPRIIDDEKENFVEGIEYLKIACDKGNYRSCAEHGYILEKSQKFLDYNQAYQLYMDSCRHGSMFACTRIGWFYDQGFSVPKDLVTSQNYFIFACKNGDGDGCRFVGNIQDESKKMFWYNLGCEKGSAMGCNSAARLLEKGEGVVKDMQRASALYQVVCEARHGYGCYNLGWVYKDGRLGEVDDLKARKYFAEGCVESQHVGSCAQWARYLYDGVGGKKNIDKAWKLFLDACSKQYYSACHFIGYCFANGENIKQDGKKALEYYSLACEQDVASSCNNIGYLYYNAKLIPQDKLKAYTYFTKACDLKNQMGCDNIKMMKDKGDFQ